MKKSFAGTLVVAGRARTRKRPWRGKAALLLALLAVALGTLAGVGPASGQIMNTCTSSISLTSGTASYTNCTITGGVINGGTLTINGGVIKGHTVAGDGGGVSNTGTLILNNVKVSGNHAPGGCGGGIYNGPTGHLIVNGGDVVGNTAQYGAGICNWGMLTLIGTFSQIRDNVASIDGGGLWNGLSATTTVVGDVGTTAGTTNKATISGNTATNGDGGGIWNLGTIDKTGTNAVAVTLNTAGHDGGGIWTGGAINGATPSTAAQSVNVVANTAQVDGGGIYEDTGGTLWLNNHLIRGNTTTTGDGGGMWTEAFPR